jgi:hypothetical protein
VTGFSHIVSLGCRCRTTRRLRDHFGFETAFPFDWWITPLEGGVRFLRDWDLGRLYDERTLREVRRWGRTAFVEQPAYGIRLQHEFPMDLRREHVLPGWRAHLAGARARTAHLMARFDQLDRPDRTVLFVRELLPGEERRSDLIEALRLAVLQRAPRARSEFVLISRTGVQAEGWRALEIDDPVKRPWSGTPAIWDPALASLGARFERRQGWGEPETPGQAEPAR